MRIFLTVPSMNLPGGIERVVSIMANYWTDIECKEVYIITYTNNEEKSYFKISQNVKILNIKISSTLVNKELNIIFKIKQIRLFKSKFKSLVEKYNPDIVFTMLHGIDMYLLKNICKDIPVVAVNHVNLLMRRGDYLHGRYKLLNKFRYRIQLFCLKRFDAVIALSRTDENRLKELGCKVVYIPNPVVEKSLSSLENKHVVCVGRLDYLKGQDRLIEIWKEIAPKFPDWKLLFVGDGRMMSTLQNNVTKYGLTDSVEFLGKRTDVESILSQSSIFAFTSRTESFGMAISEALCVGLPVVSFDCECGPRDIVFSYYNGFLIENNNKDIYIEKLTLLMQDKLLRNNLGINAVESMRKFSVNIVMSLYNDLIIDVCA